MTGFRSDFNNFYGRFGSFGRQDESSISTKCA